jgi:hypothetical protein
VCLALPDRSDKKFLRKTFIGNFKNEYLFMYILLLHQKYVMYLLLTRIGVGMNKDLGALEKYKEDLYDFETNFIFTHITEVPQYQMLYEKIYDAFSLKQMFDDVHDPLLSLEEIKRKTFEDEQKKADENLNMAITSLSYLSIISVFTDTFGLADGFTEWLSSTFEGLGLKCMADCIVSDTASSIFGALGLVGTAAIVAICLYRIKRFSSNKTKDKRSKKDER